MVGWGRGKCSWSIDAGVIPGDPSDASDRGPWPQVNALLARMYPHDAGRELPIGMLAVDSGYQTQHVYAWARKHPISRVIAVKGHDAATVLIGSPSRVDVTVSGKKLRRGYKVWPVATSLAKSELYGWLALQIPIGDDVEPIAPPGYRHFPEHEEEYFRQLTAEQLVPRKSPKGYTTYGWELIAGRENHYLDARIYARCAAALVGLDRFKESDWQTLERAVGVARTPAIVRPPREDREAGLGAAESVRPGTAPAPAAQGPRRSWLGPRRGRWLRTDR